MPVGCGSCQDLTAIAQSAARSLEQADRDLDVKFGVLLVALSWAGTQLATACTQSIPWPSTLLLALVVWGLFARAVMSAVRGLQAVTDVSVGPDAWWIWDKYGRDGHIDLVNDSVMRGMRVYCDLVKKRQHRRASRFNAALRQSLIFFFSALFFRLYA